MASQMDNAGIVQAQSSSTPESEECPKSGIWKFVETGIVAEDGIYIRRKADTLLSEILQEGIPAYILGPRRVGKSSLANRTIASLQQSTTKWHCVSISLENITKETTDEQIYLLILNEILEKLNAMDRLKEYWQSYNGLSVGDRWVKIIEKIVLGTDASILLFLDEVDSVSLLGEARCGSFFGTLRRLIQDLQIQQLSKRFVFCLGGVTSPMDLVQNTQQTPFNIIKSVYLEDFTREEVKKLRKGFLSNKSLADDILDRIYYWTSGHPALTQKICFEFVKAHKSKISRNAINTIIDDLVQERLLAPKLDYHGALADTSRRFGHVDRGPHIRSMLDLYEKILQNQAVELQSSDPTQIKLRLTGLAAERPDPETRKLILRTRNKIFEHFFNGAWLVETRKHHLIDGWIYPWLQNGRSKDFLVQGKQLRVIKEWAVDHERQGKPLQEDERDFLAACTEADSRRRRIWYLAVGFVMAVMVGLAFSVRGWRLELKQNLQQAEQTRIVQDALRETERAKEQERRTSEQLRAELQRLAEARADAVAASPEERSRVDSEISQLSRVRERPPSPSIPMGPLRGGAALPLRESIEVQLHDRAKKARETGSMQELTAWRHLSNHVMRSSCRAAIPGILSGTAVGLDRLHTQVRRLIDDHQYEAALPLAECLYAGRSIVFGMESEPAYQTLQELPFLYYKNREHLAEKESTELALKMSGKIYGWDSIQVARARDALALVYLRKANNALASYAAKEYESSIKIKERLLHELKQRHKNSRILEEEIQRTRAAQESARSLVARPQKSAP